MFSLFRRIRFYFRRKLPSSRRTQEWLVFQAAALTEYSKAFSAEALRSQEGQQVGVNGIGLGCGHAVRKAFVGFQCAIFEQFRRQWPRIGIWHDLVVIAMHHQDRHGDLLQVFGEKCNRPKSVIEERYVSLRSRRADQ